MTKEELQKIFDTAAKETIEDFRKLTAEDLKKLYGANDTQEYELQFLIPFELAKRLTFKVLEKILCTNSQKDSTNW